MVHVDKLDLEASGLHDLACFMRKELDPALEMVLFELELDQPGRQARAVNGAAELLHGIRNAADVVLVAVR